MSQVKSCDCETCKLKVDLYERDKTNGIRENVSGAFIFCEEALCSLESTCEFFFFNFFFS